MSEETKIPPAAEKPPVAAQATTQPKPAAMQQKAPQKPLTPLADAVKEVGEIDPAAQVDNRKAFLVYRKHYKGREKEVSFADFLSELKKV